MSLETKLLIGGTSVEEDRNFSNNVPHVVIGTPGRIKDMIERKSLKTKNLTTLLTKWMK